jgi:DNA-binding MarR family transcriptional regulator
MAPERLSRLQRRILRWLAREARRTQGTMAASHEDLVQALHARGYDKGNLSHSLANLAAKGSVRATKTPGGLTEAIDLTPQGRARLPPRRHRRRRL